MRLRLLALAAAVLLGPAPEVCGALNVTVSPGPVVDYLEGENATLLCHVSQKRRKDSLLAVRWFFAPDGSQEALMVKMTKLRIIQYYGNFSRTANQQRLRLLEERRGVLYRLSVLTLRPTDQGQYVCKVQEISKHRNKWTAWSNGSSATEMRVISLKAGEDSSFEKKKVTWAFFEDHRGKLDLCRAGADQTTQGCQRRPHQHRVCTDPLRGEPAVAIPPLWLSCVLPVVYDTQKQTP